MRTGFLGTLLFSELSPKFFGLLTGPNARVYLDAVDAIEREMQGDAMERAEALAIIDGVFASGAVLQAESETEEEEPEPGPPSATVLRRLLAARWMEEEKRSDYRQVLYLEPAAQMLVEALRTIVSQTVASFTGRLRLVCERLAALREEASRRELIWEELRNCLSQVRSGLRELRTIRKQVERYAQRQLRTATIADALDIIYNEFSTLITQQCYRELIHARLPERLRDAQEGLTRLERDEAALERICHDLLRLEPEAQHPRRTVTETIEALATALGEVEPTADRVDTSAADFARRSRARIRYIQDVGSARRQQVKVVFDYVRDRLEGVRLADLEERLELPALRLAEVGLLGESSLARRRERAGAARQQPVAEPLTESDREESLREMEKNVRDSLRLDRANRFFEQLELERGTVMSSHEMPIRTEDDLLDVISCLVFAPAGGARYRLRTLREDQPSAPVQMDPKGDFTIERFEMEPK